MTACSRYMAGGDPVKRLMGFVRRGRVPNLIFHGPAGAGKRVALGRLLRKIYGEGYCPELVMTVDCARRRGTAFVRDDLKQFAQSQLGRGMPSVAFRSVVMLNADSLTHDAQSALRRCIEIYSHSTRFFLLARDKSKLLHPVASRFCALYFRLPPGSPSQDADRRPPPCPRAAQREKRLLSLASAALKKRLPVNRAAESLYAEGYAGTDLLSTRLGGGIEAGDRLYLDGAMRALGDERIVLASVLMVMGKAGVR